jgi:hypothetical protein
LKTWVFRLRKIKKPLRGFFRLRYNEYMDENLDLSKNSELQEALQQFEEKQKTQPVVQVAQQEVSRTPKMIRLVMKLSKGAIKNESQASYLLYCFSYLEGEHYY